MISVTPDPWIECVKRIRSPGPCCAPSARTFCRIQNPGGSVLPVPTSSLTSSPRISLQHTLTCNRALLPTSHVFSSLLSTPSKCPSLRSECALSPASTIDSKMLLPRQAAAPPPPILDRSRYESIPLLNHRSPLLALTITFIVRHMCNLFFLWRNRALRG